MTGALAYAADRMAAPPAHARRIADLYRGMVTIRAAETALLSLFDRGRLRGTVHTCLGQEAIAAGVVGALDPARDAVCSNHRGHGHFIAYCDDVEGLIAEIMGLPGGVCGGKGGSQHLQVGNFYANGILGGMAPVAAGIAFAEREKKTGGVSVLFHGDGAMAEGVIYETLNLAALWHLPLILAIERNGYAQSTPTALEIAGNLEDRGTAFGIPSQVIDGNDIQAVDQAARDTVGAVRGGGGPRILVLDTYRLGPHSKGDDDRPAEEIAAAAARCPITRARPLLEPRAAARIEAEVEHRLRATIERLDPDRAGAP